MTTTTPARRAQRRPARRPLPPEERVGTALFRLQKERVLQTVIRGAVPVPVLRRLLADAISKKEASTLPGEMWAAMAANFAAESADYGLLVAQALHDRLAWDEEPEAAEQWERIGQERPLEALWMAALSESRSVRKAFPQFAAACLKAYHASPASRPPSWEFVEEILTVHGAILQDLRDAERDLSDAERRHDAERQRSDDLRDELKRLRRETSELRAEKAQAEKKAAAALEARARIVPGDAQRLEELERRLRKADKENEHLRRELERARPEPSPAPTHEVPEIAEEPPLPEPALPPLSEDPNPRRRVMRQMLRKLFKKGKIGASHTHEDNVYRGVPDHDKGTAKAIIDLLYREGVLMPKPTTTDPHVSLRPERTGEVRSIVAGTIENPRIRRFVEEGE